jgi:hypothetical protein
LICDGSIEAAFNCATVDFTNADAPGASGPQRLVVALQVLASITATLPTASASDW